MTLGEHGRRPVGMGTADAARLAVRVIWGGVLGRKRLRTVRAGYTQGKEDAMKGEAHEVCSDR